MEETTGPIPIRKTPTHAEMKAALRDETLPEIVKRNIREQLYGEGGGGRKAAQQQRLLREAQRPVQPVASPPTMKRPAGMSGRQFKRARRLIRQGRKVVFGAESRG